MLKLLGSPRRCCDGLTRRESLQVGGLSALSGLFNLPGLLHVAFVRSPQARARIGSIDLALARAMPGVIACFSAAYLGPTALVQIAQLLPNPNLK